MKDQNYTAAFTVDQTPEEAFAAINNVRGWWTGDIEGSTDKPGDEFTYRYKDIHYSKQKITELIPGKKVVWRVLDASLNFVEDRTEWNGSEITFQISQQGDKTEVRFTHVGLVPEHQCYNACSGAWGSYRPVGLDVPSAFLARETRGTSHVFEKGHRSGRLDG